MFLFSFSFSSFQFSSCSKDFFILFELIKLGFFSHPVLVFWLVLVCYNSLALGTIKYLYQTSQALFSASLLSQARWLTDGAYFSIFFLCTHAHIHLPCTHTLHTYWLADSCTCYWFVSLHYLIKILRLCGIPLCHVFCSRFISYKYNMITSALFLLVEQHKHIRGLYYEMGSELSLSFQ